MLSRVADTLFWTARYLERAENTARFIDISLQMSLDARMTFAEQWDPVVAITGEMDAFRSRYASAERDNVIDFLSFDRENPNSILSCVTKARENARSIREIISSEMWEQINRFYLEVSEASTYYIGEPLYGLFSNVRRQSYVIAGSAETTMTHDEAWHFYQLGRHLERADNGCRLIDVKYFLLLPSVEYVGTAVDELQWAILLRCATALEAYRRQFGRITPANVIELLLRDRDFPRAVLFCLGRCEDSLHAISGSPYGTFHNDPERLIGQLRSRLAFTPVYDIIAAGLHEFLEDFTSRLIAVGSSIEQAFFGYQPPAGPDAREDKDKEMELDLLSGHKGQ